MPHRTPGRLLWLLDPQEEAEEAIRTTSFSSLNSGSSTRFVARTFGQGRNIHQIIIDMYVGTWPPTKLYGHFWEG